MNGKSPPWRGRCGFDPRQQIEIQSGGLQPPTPGGSGEVTGTCSEHERGSDKAQHVLRGGAEAARLAHNQEVGGSSPPPATRSRCDPLGLHPSVGPQAYGEAAEHDRSCLASLRPPPQPTTP